MNSFNPPGLLLAKEKFLQKIKSLNLFNDTFVSVVFKNKGACLHLIRELMHNPTLKIIEIRTQNDIPQLISHGVRLDILAEDEQGTIYEIEIQRVEEIAPARRMRFYSSVIDSELLRKGVKYDQLPEVYLFYISEADIWHKDQTVYEVKSILSYAENNAIPYDNGLHTIYVNAAVDDGSSIAKLMNYFKTAKAGDTSQGALSDYVNELKSPEGGKRIMGEFEKYYHELGFKEGVASGEARGEKIGEARGKEIGEARFAKLMDKLFSLGRFEDAKRITQDKQYRAQLMKEFAIQ